HEVTIDEDGDKLHYHWVDRSEVASALPERIGTITRPFTVHLMQRVEGGGPGKLFFFTATPHTVASHTNYLWVLENRPLTQDQLAKEKEVGETIMGQDRRIVEEQRPEELPVDLSEELHVRGPDAIAIRYRGLMAELGAAV